MSGAGRRARRGRGRRRSRPRPRRPRRGRRRRASSAASISGSRPGAVGAGLGAEDPGGGAPLVAVLGQVGRRVRAHVVVLVRLVQARRPAARRRRAASTTCGNASRKKPEMRTVTSMRGRPSSASGIDLEAGDPARRLVPDRPARRAAPAPRRCRRPAVRIALVPHTDRPTERGYVAGVGAVAGQQRVGQRLAGLPGQPRRDRLGVDGVEVAAGRQHVDQPAQRRAGRPGRDVAAVEGVQRRGRSRRWCRPAAARPRSAANSSTPRDRRVAPSTSATTAAGRRGAQPASSIACDQRAGLRLDRVDVGRVGAPSSSSPSASRRPGQRVASPPQIWRARRIASTRLTRASPVGRVRRARAGRRGSARP